MSALGRLADCTCPEGTAPGQFDWGCEACTDFHDYLWRLGRPDKRHPRKDTQ